MNKIYRIVWSQARQCLVVVGENARVTGKSSAAVKDISPSAVSSWLRTMAIALLTMAAVFPAFAAPQTVIQPDGRTQTVVGNSGTVYNVSTSTVTGSNAFNSFNVFNIGAGNSVNLMVPSSALNLINIIRDQRTDIYGTLNAIKDGRIGGNIWFANPHGFVVGAGGVVNVGSLTVATPTQRFVDNFFPMPGSPDQAAVAQLLSGSAPRSGTGLISILGKVNAIDGINLSAGAINVAGSIYSGARFIGTAPDFTDVVNANGLVSATNVVVKEGKIQIVADNDITVSGTIAAPGGAGVRGGDISIRAGGNVELNAGANVSARGNGANSSGGAVNVWGDNNASFHAGAVLDASAGSSGDGGAIELSVRNLVTLAGGHFKAGAETGRAGSILIDPSGASFDWNGASYDMFTDGAALSVIASDFITLNDVFLSTRKVAAGDANRANIISAASTGDSGSLELHAPIISVGSGTRLLTHASGSYTAGKIELLAEQKITLGDGARVLASHASDPSRAGDVDILVTDINAIGANRTADAGIKAENADIRGRNVKLSANAETSLIVHVLEQNPGISLEAAQAYLNSELDDLVSDGPGGEYLAVKTKATAKTELYGTNIEGSGNVTIEAKAGARAGFVKEATADVTIGDLLAADGTTVLAKSKIQGGKVAIASTADTSLTFNVLGTVLRLADQSWLPDPAGGELQRLNDQLFDFSEVPLVSLSTSKAHTTISGDTHIGAQDTLDISAMGISAAKPTFSSPLLFSAAWGESTVEALTTVGGITRLDATNKATVKAGTDAEVNVTADVNSINKPIDAVFVRAENTATTTVTVGDTTTTSAGSVDALASAKADISAGALAKNTGGSGVGIAVAVNQSTTTTTATLGGDVTATTGNIKVDATTDIIKNNTSAEAATLGDPNTISAKITNFKAGIQRNVTSSILKATGKLKPETSDRISSFLFPGIKEGKFNLSGAVTYTDAVNTATASIAPSARVKAEGNIDVTAKVNDRPNASVGSKATSTGTAIGGSAIIAGFTNNADAYIGSGATVDAKGKLLVDAQTVVPYAWQIDWNSPAAILNHLQEGILDMVLTSYAINSAKGKSGLGLAAAVSVFDLQNNANAWIAEGAKVNTLYDKDTFALPNQAVTVHARNDINTVNAVGLLSLKFLGTSGGKAAIGGSGNIIDITENASATIRGNAQVKSETTVDIKAENVNQLVTVTEAGGSSDQIGIEGAVSINTLNGKAVAAIDDDAKVDAGGNVNVEALGDVEVISVAGGVVATKGQAGIGFSVSLNTIDTGVSAYVGNYDPLLLDNAPAAGQVKTGGDLKIKATSDTEIGAYSVTGALATDSKAQTEVPADAKETKDGTGSAAGSSGSGKGKFGIAVSGDASVNDIKADTLAYISDGASISQAHDATLNADNTLAINALAGAVTISTQKEGNGLAGSYAQNTLTGTTAAYLADTSLTLSGALDMDANVSGEINTLSASVQGTKGKIGVAGSVSVNEITNTTQAYLSGSTLRGVQAVSMTALDDSFIKSIAGAIAFGGKAGIGLSFAWNKLDNLTQTYVNTSDVDAAGDVTLSATTDNSIDTISAAIGASTGNMAGAGAVSVNTLGNETRAWIAGQKNGDGVDSSGNITVGAGDKSRIFAIAGGLAATTGKAAFGLSFAWSDVNNIVDAAIRTGADVESTAGDVKVTADSTTEVQAFAVGGSFANKVGIGGSASVVQGTNNVTATVDGTSRVTADGNVLVSASDDVDIFSLGGNVAGAGAAAIAVANSTLITDNRVEATLGAGADVNARGKHAAGKIYTGEKDGSGNRTKEDVTGLAISATSFEDIQTIAAGGAGGGKAGIAGSATVTVMDEKTYATVGAGAKVNDANDGGAAQNVLVHASDATKLLGVAGAVAFGGSAGVGAGAEVGVIDKDTRADINSSGATPTTVKAKSNIIVEALSTEKITSVAASLAAGGSAGIAGSASVYDLGLGTAATIGNSAKVRADGSVVVSADNATEMDMIAGNGAFGGAAGVGASAAVQVVDKSVTASIGDNAEVNGLGKGAGIDVADGGFAVAFGANSGAEGEISAPSSSNSGSNSQALTQQRSAARSTKTIHGVAVSATNQDDIESISATGSIAGTAAITLAGNVNVITTDTSASIGAGAKVNQDKAAADAGQSVLVAAGNDYYHMGVAGSGSGAGAVGIGVGADVTVANLTTGASVGTGALVNARKDVEVLARAEEEVLSISASLGVAGTVGVSGSVSVLALNTATSAVTGTDSTVDAGGNARISARDDTETDMIAGTVAIGIGGAGVGGAVGITSLSKNTTAAVGTGATINARGNDTGLMTAYSGNSVDDTGTIKGLSVEASSSEDVFSVAAAGAGGFFAGVSGAVTVQTVDSDTHASIASNAKINKGVTDGNVEQDVNVSARNSTRSNVIAGSLGVGAVGVAGGVDVGNFKNDTSASIGNGAEVHAARDVDVNALSRTEIDSVVVSAAGGLGAIAGGVAVYSVGTGLDKESKDQLKSDGGDFADVNGYADNQAADGSIGSLLAGSSDSRIQSISSDAQAKRSAVSISGQLNNPAPSGNAAFIDGATVEAGSHVDISARQKIDIDILTGAASVGALGLGAGIGVVNVSSASQAFISGTAQVEAGGNVQVTAHSDDTGKLNSYVGTGGIVAVNAALAIYNDDSSTIAYLGSGVQIDKADQVEIDATALHNVNTRTFGISVGAAAGGLSKARTDIGGTVGASVYEDVGVGQDSQNAGDSVGSLSVSAQADSHGTAHSQAAAGGIVAGQGSIATAEVGPTVTAGIGSRSAVTVDSAVTVEGNAEAAAAATAEGVSISVAGVGSSEATARAKPKIIVGIGEHASITAAQLDVVATRSIGAAPSALARATGSSGGLLLGVNATVATAEGTGETSALVGADSTLAVTGVTTVRADSASQQTSSGEGFSAGFIAVGADYSYANSNTLTQAVLGDRVKVSGNTLQILAASDDTNYAYGLAGSGGIASAPFSEASTSNTSQTYARTGSGNNTAGNARKIDVTSFFISASHGANFDSWMDSTNASLIGVSGAKASNSVDARSEAHIGTSGYVEADNITMQAHNDVLKYAPASPQIPGLSRDVPAWNVNSSSGGLVDVPAAGSTTTIVTNALVQADAGAHLEQTGDRNAPGVYALDAWNSVTARDKVKMSSGGAVSAASGKSAILADSNNATVREGEFAEMISVGDIALGARSVADLYTQTAVDVYGLVGVAPAGDSVSRFQAANTIDIGAGASMESLHDIKLSAGANTADAGSDIRATARTDVYNNTAIPVNRDPVADAIIGTHGQISIGSGADVAAVRHVSLYAEEGATTASGVGIGKDIWRETLAKIASAISNAFGGGDVSFETRTGRSIKNQTTDVEVNGDVRVGIHRKQELVIGPDGTPTKQTDGISITGTGFRDIAADILSRINDLEGLIRQYTVDNANADASIAVAAYRSEIAFLERKLDELGFPRNGQPGFSGVATISPRQAAQEAVTGMSTTRHDYDTQKTTLATENTTLASTNTNLANTNNGLTGTNTSLTSTNTTLANQNTALIADNAQWQQKLDALPAADPARATFQSKIDANNATIASNNTTISNNNTTISNNTATINSNTATINSNTATINSNNTQLAQLDGQIGNLDTQISTVQANLAITDPNDQNYLSPVAAGGPVAKFLTISDSLAQLGNIYVRGDRLHGNGMLDAPGDAEIKITNNGPNFLILKNLTIPPDEGGKVYFNSVDVKGNAQINNVNGAAGGAAFKVFTAESEFDSNGNPVTPGKPRILVESKYDPLDPLYIAQTPANVPTLAPDIILQGDVSNLRGLVKIDSAAGSIRLEQKRDSAGNLILPPETANVRADDVEIKTRNGDFVQSYTDTFFHTAGAPLTTSPGDSHLAFPGNIARIDRTPESAGSGIVANGSVLIAARYLNINGNVQSGIPEWGVRIPASATVTIPGAGSGSFAQAQAHYNALSPAAKAALGAEFYDVSGATLAGLTGNVQGNWEKVTVRYNARENRLELGGVRVQGGYIELFGQIFNTNQNNGGKLRVMDGYGQIKVDNETSLPLWVNLLDTGRGVSGEINITNIAGIRPDNSVDDDGKPNGGTPIIMTRTFTRNPGASRSGDFYDPTAGLRYVMTVGYDQVKVDYYRYSQNGWFGITSAPVLDRYKINSITRSNDPLSQGEFLQVWPTPSVSNAYFPSSPAVYGASSITGGRQQTQTTSSVKTPGRSWKDCNWWTLCANATYYMEYTVTRGTKTTITDSVRGDYPIGIEYIGFDQGNVGVSSIGNVVMNAAINNRNGNTSVSSAGSIIQNGDLPIIGGNNVTLSAGTGIGAPAQSLLVNVKDGKLDAVSTSGEVRVGQVVGDLKVGTIGGAGVSNVVLEADRNLLAWNTSSYIQGQRVELLSRNGGIGALSDTVNDPLIVRTGYTTNQAQWPNNGLMATARDNINIKNVGDPGNASVYSGNLLLIAAESLAGDVRIETAGKVIDNNPFATTDTRTQQELADLWDALRLRGALAVEKADEAVAAFENGKNNNYQLYWQLRKRQPDQGTLYDPGFHYTVSQAEHDALAASGMNALQISQFADNRTAQYHQLHAEVGGFTAAYTPGFRYDATAAEEAQIRKGSSWTDAQLALSVGAGLLKNITDTVTTIKEPNAKGRNVTLIAGTDIGSLNDPLTIDLSAGLNALTTEQKAALAAAERGDATLDNSGNIITITQPRPVNVTTGLGALNATASTGFAFIGSEQDLRIDRINAAKDIRIKTAGSLFSAPSVPGAANFAGDSMILEAANGGIGAANAPMRINASSSAGVIARAAGDIWIDAAQDLAVDTMFSRGDIRLGAVGSILDFHSGESSVTPDNNLRGNNIWLAAQTGSIGTPGNPLDAGVNPDGLITASASTFGKGVYLNGPAGESFNIGSVISGDAVWLSSATGMKIAGPVAGPGAISLVSGGPMTMTPNADVHATTLGVFLRANTLTMEDDGTHAARVRVDAGTIDIETVGDALITGIETGNPTASAIRIVSTAGRILDNGDTRLDIVADTEPEAKLTISGALGIGDNPLDIRVHNLEASSGGIIDLAEENAVNIVSITAGDRVLLTAGGDITGNSVTSTGTGNTNPDKSISITSSGGSVNLASVSGQTDVAVSGRNGVSVDMLNVGSNLVLAGPHVSAAVNGGSGTVGGSITGFGGGIASDVNLTLSGSGGFAFDNFFASTANVNLPLGAFSIDNALIVDRATFVNPLSTVLVDQHNRSIQPSDVQLYSAGVPFSFSLSENHIATSAFAIHHSPLHEVITPDGPNFSVVEQGEDALSMLNLKRLVSERTPVSEERGSLVTYTGVPVSLECDPDLDMECPK